jgi:SAM-dependent methyltransferase
MKGPETQRSENRRSFQFFRERGLGEMNFFGRFMQGHGLDIGYKGSLGDRAETVLPTAIGVDQDYPGYDGKTLPFCEGTQDYVYSSHCLEHMMYPTSAIREWFRVLKVGGYLVITVPHRDLYEKKLDLPSRWNAGHRRFYLPSDLLQEIERALAPNSYRIRYLQDCDEDYSYSVGPDVHPSGEYQIECVVQKLDRPKWGVT